MSKLLACCAELSHLRQRTTFLQHATLCACLQSLVVYMHQFSAILRHQAGINPRIAEYMRLAAQVGA